MPEVTEFRPLAAAVIVPVMAPVVRVSVAPEVLHRMPCAMAQAPVFVKLAFPTTDELSVCALE